MGEIIVAVFGIYLILQMIIGYRRGLIKSIEEIKMGNSEFSKAKEAITKIDRKSVV